MISLGLLGCIIHLLILLVLSHIIDTDVSIFECSLPLNEMLYKELFCLYKALLITAKLLCDALGPKSLPRTNRVKLNSML